MDREHSGYDQRWACITITAYLDPAPVLENTEGSKYLKPALTSNGHALSRRTLTSAQAEALAVEFIGDPGPDIVSVDKIKEWSKE